MAKDGVMVGFGVGFGFGVGVGFGFGVGVVFQIVFIENWLGNLISNFVKLDFKF